MFILFLVFGLLCLAGGVYFAITKMKVFCQNHKALKLEKKDFLYLGIECALFAASGLLIQLAIQNGCKWNMTGGETAMSLIGAFLFMGLLGAFCLSFTLKHYKADFDKKQAKINGILVYVLPILAICAFLLLGEGVAQHLVYPLVSGFSIGSNGFQWVTYQNSSSGFHVAWYALCILLGAVLAYKISDHNFYKEFKKHGIIDSLFVIALIGGILGARIWYVVGNFEGDAANGLSYADEIAKGNWFSMFQIWNGGLTILGGAVAGIIVGMVYMTKKRKYVDLRFAVDACVPTILLAQAIGRWGNFFNHEVYGVEVSMSTFSFLPTWIRYQMATGFSNGMPNGTTMYVPLFLIEGIINIIGYFVIAKLIPAVWPESKGRAKGDLVGFYLIWYGIVRIILEPMRSTDFNMGSNGMWSIWNSLIYIILGAFVVAVFQLLALYEKKKGLPDQSKTYSIFYMILEVGFFGIGAWFTIDGAMKMGGAKAPAYIFVFVLGLVLLILNGFLFYRSLKRFKGLTVPPVAEIDDGQSKLEDDSKKTGDNTKEE